MQYYSRTNGEDKELLEEHLLKTSKLCEEYMTKIGMPVTGRIIGRIHDIGKHTKKFQEVLDGTRTHVNHAIVGGFLIDKILKCPELGYITASHHSGLKKKWEYLDYKIKYAVDCDGKENALSGDDELLEILDWLQRTNLKVTKEEFDAVREECRTAYTGLNANQRMFISRMIFSCLVDADYSASASFGNPDYLDEYNRQNLEPEVLIEKLNTYRQNIILNSDSNPELNKLRDEVFKACALAGSNPSRNSTLTAPTGTAKTLATLRFALEHAKTFNRDSIIFVLPYLSIIEQNAKIYRDICGDDTVLESDSQVILDDKARILSERWSAPIIVTTAVTFFETLFKDKGTSLRKLHNLCNSVVVFDEAQTLPTDVIDSTLEIVNLLNEKFNVTTLFSTATQPSFNYRKNVKNMGWHPYEIIGDPQTLYDRYAKIKRLSVNWMIDGYSTYGDLYSMVENKDSYLFIFNIKRHSLEFYEYIKSNVASEDLDSLFFLNTNLCPAHRTKVITEINARLKRGLKARVISTQCLEAGVDLDFQYVYRALAPVSSIIQAAGRTSRNANKPGELTVFMLDDKTLYPNRKYKVAANQTKRIVSKRDSYDINKLSDIDEYYKWLFGTIGHNSDSSKLTAAIQRESYDDVSKEYKLIDRRGVNVIVPYQDELELFNAIKISLDKNGGHINKAIIRSARKITVVVYERELTERFCQKLPFRIRKEDVDSDWYILHDSNLYDVATGLNFRSESDFIV